VYAQQFSVRPSPSAARLRGDVELTLRALRKGSIQTQVVIARELNVTPPAHVERGRSPT
jgi:hypothetical protein